MTLLPIPGRVINAEAITHVTEEHWKESQPDGRIIHHTGVKVNFIGGTTLRLPEPDATALRKALGMKLVQ